MNIEIVFNKVAEVIEKSIGKSKESIQMEQTLFDDIGIDSIDLVDIFYELETAFDIELKVSDFEAKAREEMKDKPYEIDGVITSEGLEVIKQYMTELDQSKLVEGITVHQLIKLFTVHSLCKLVLYKLNETQEHKS